jgi:hypothetical protein
VQLHAEALHLHNSVQAGLVWRQCVTSRLHALTWSGLLTRWRWHRHDSLMHLRAALTLSVIGLCSNTACLANLRADKKIGDAVQNLNNQARWGRINDAVLLVHPEYRETFLNQHSRWGTDIQLADAEVVNIQIANDSKNASAFVSYSWYAMADMTLHETTLRQLWEAENSSYALSGETVVKGDPGLLATAP